MVTQLNLLDPLVDLNNQGCYLLGKRKHDDAMGQFKAALLYLRSSLHSNDGDKNKSTNTKTPMMVDCGISPPSLRALHLRDFQKMLSANVLKGSGGADNTLLPDTGNYVTFSWALPIVPGYNFSCQAADNEKVFTAVAVFNLALTLHLRALDCRGGGCSFSLASTSSCCFHHQLLKKAQSLYLHTHQLIVPIVNAYLRHGQASDNVAFDLLVMGLLNNMGLIHMELLESADCLGAFQRLIQYVKISSFRWRAVTCRLYPPTPHAVPGPAPSVVGVGGGIARSILPTTTQHDDDHRVWQPGLNRSTFPEEEEEEFRRIHNMVDQVVNDMIWTATYQKLNVRRIGVAAAA